jgi:hypothetical protein
MLDGLLNRYSQEHYHVTLERTTDLLTCDYIDNVDTRTVSEKSPRYQHFSTRTPRRR